MCKTKFKSGWCAALLSGLLFGPSLAFAEYKLNMPEMVTTPEAGVLMEARTPEEIARAVEKLREHYPDSAATRRYAERFSWDATTSGQLALFSRLLKTTITTRHPHA